jgi:hypothetical protein
MVLALLALASGSAITACLGTPRHVDPSALPERLGIVELLNLLASSSELLASLNVGGPKNLTSILAEAPVPQVIKEVYDRTLEAYSRFIDYVNETLARLDLAERALSLSNLTESEMALRKAESLLAEARTTYAAFRDTYTYLTRVLSPSMVGVAGKTLENAARALDELSRRVSELSARLSEALVSNLTAVTVEAYVNSTHTLYGDTVNVWGRVTDIYGRPLVGRKVVASFSDYAWVGRTGEGGFFNLTLPVYGCGRVALSIAYLPTGGDISIYRYAEARLNLTVTCRVPVLRLVVPGALYVGTRPTLCVESNIDGLDISLSIVGINVNATARVTAGRACASVSIPGGTKEGVYKVLILSKPSKGVPPARVVTYVNISKIPVSTAISYPRFLLAGFPAEICVYPEVPSDVFLSYPSETKLLRGAVACTHMGVPAVYLGTELPVSIYVKPLNSTYRETLTKIRLPVVNVYVVALTALTAVLLVSLHREGVAGVPEAGRSPPAKTSGSGVAEVSPLTAEFIEVIKSVGGGEPERGMTLREYVEKVLNSVGAAVRDVLKQCLTLLERILYGPQASADELIKKLRELLRSLRRGSSSDLAVYTASGLLAAAVVLSTVVYIVPSTDDLSPYNPLWNGLTRLVSDFNASVVAVGDVPSLDPRTSALLVIGAGETLSNGSVNVLREFVRGGGVLVVADESPYSNKVVEALGVDALLGTGVVVDTVFAYRDPRLPLARARFPSANLTLYLNYATYINTSRAGNCLAWTFLTSYIDLNLNGSREGYEPSGPLCVAYMERVGDGLMYLVSDSSIFINSMLGLGDNRAFVRAVVGSRAVYVLYGGSTSQYSRFREFVLSTYSTLFYSWIRYPLSIVIALGVYRVAGSRGRRKTAEVILPGLPYSFVKDFEKVVRELGDVEG